MDTMQVNLARKWRSTTFDEIVGQELAVRLIKNSLYRGQFFPVYLLSGQRGCGKTTMGRVFAAAVNCERLSDFQQQPQTIAVPCLHCSSCSAMQSGKHPDFIEIDAASHTGVDNVRALVESASYLPVLGRKKIYLIDEAHMLSKAAFNALLKVLEEPPHDAVFMLATTDVHKIIDTVRSRCFQLFFNPVLPQHLIAHLEYLCKQENIAYTMDGLAMVAQESEGSVRDAINLIERIRLVHDSVTQSSVAKLLGAVPDEQLVEVFSLVLRGENIASIMYQARQWQKQGYQARAVWKRLTELIRASLFVYHQKDLGVYDPFSLYQQTLRGLMSGLNVATLVRLWELCYEVESMMIKTTMQQGVVELLLLRMVALLKPLSSSSEPVTEKPLPVTVPDGVVNMPKLVTASKWEKFLEAIEKLNDPLVYSMFKHARLVAWDERGKVEVVFPENFMFFKEMLTTTERVWKSVMQDLAGSTVTFVPNFQATLDAEREPLVPKPVITQQEKPIGRGPIAAQKKTSDVVAVRDQSNYPQASLLLEAFPGTLYQKQDTAL